METEYLYAIVTVGLYPRKDGTVRRDVMLTGFIERDERSYTASLFAKNGTWANAAMIACDSASVEAWEDDKEYCDRHDLDRPDLEGWLILWMAGDIRREDIASVLASRFI